MNSYQKGLAAFTLLAVSAALAEAMILSYRKPGAYDWGAYWASLGVAVGRRVTDFLPLWIAMPGGQWLYEHRLIDADLQSWWGLMLLFFGLEFLYYWFHRLSHTVRWFWANHAVHHSPNQMNLSTAYRLGALEGIINTPSAHRVHHAANLEYLDANYGGVLMIFDRLFGTYVPERHELPCRFGWVQPLHSNNIFVIVFCQWVALLRDVRAARSLRDAIGYLWHPPGWVPQGEGMTTVEMRARAAQ